MEPWGTSTVEEEVGGDCAIGLNNEINSKIYVSRDPIWALKIDGIVHSTNENLSEMCDDMKRAAGAREMAIECNLAELCKTGDSISTRACELPCKRIIHTVGPRYCEKYAFAAANALHYCYRNSLRIAIEDNLKSIAFPCIYKKRKMYPREEAAHIAIRTIRRFLENFPHTLEKIVFCIEMDSDYDIYQSLLPLYFPRTKEELQQAIHTLPQDLGNEHGEPIVEDRKIKIQSFEPESSHSIMTSTEFTQMNADFDAERLARFSTTEYAMALRKASCLDLDDQFEQLDIIYHAGVDHNGDPVIAFIANRLKRHVDVNQLQLYMISIMDGIVNQPYSFLYVQTDAGVNLGWFSELFQLFDAKYHINLKAFYVLHPTKWLKLTFWLVFTKHYYNKLVYFDHYHELSNVAARLRLPANLGKYTSSTSAAAAAPYSQL